MEDAIKCGEYLQQQKASMKHGEWVNWVESNCDFSYPTAALYMKAASNKANGLDFSSLRRLYGPRDDTKPTKVKKEDAGRHVLPPPTQVQAEAMALFTGVEELELPMSSPDGFISVNGTGGPSEKFKENVKWLTTYLDMCASVDAAP